MIQDSYQRSARKLRISLTDRCQMRCTYCMPSPPAGGFLAPDAWLSFSQITTVAAVAEELGITSLRLTGGEPLTRADVPQLVAMLRQRTTIPRIAMTTNGILLPRYATDLAAAGLSDITISLDTLHPNRMQRLGGGDYLDSVLRGIDAACGAGFAALKINSVVIRGINDDELHDLATFAWRMGAEPRFIEYMPMDEHWQRELVLTADEIVQRMQDNFGTIEALYNPVGSTSMRYRLLATGSFFAVIPTLSHAFCGDCDRIRLTADGRVLGCLYSDNGPSVRDVLRANPTDTEGIARVLQLSYTQRGPGYMRQLLHSPDRLSHHAQMHVVGG